MFKISDLKTFSLWLSFAVVWALSITLTFYTWNIAPAAAVVSIQFVAAALVLGIFYGQSAYRILDELVSDWKNGRRKGLALVVGMAMTLGLGYLLMVLKRYGFAPSGSDIVFLLETIPLFVLIIIWLYKDEKVTLGKIAGAGAALLGGIAVVGNWERPSSFSPFSRFPYEEMLLVLSAVFLAWFFVLLWRQARTRPVTELVTLSVWIAAPFLLIAAIAIGGVRASFEISLDAYTILALTGAIGIALPVFLLSLLAKRLPVSTASSAIFLSPVIITLLIGVEKSSAALGAGIMATPFLWVPVITGCLITVMGVTTAWAD